MAAYVALRADQFESVRHLAPKRTRGTRSSCHKRPGVWRGSAASESQKMEDLKSYLDAIAEPTIKDFENNPTSVRHAFLACVAVFHGIDYLAYPRRQSSYFTAEI
jgi:hypothetical protein